MDAPDARRIVERAVPRPATPIYSQLSEILQINLHRALTNQTEPEAALREAARSMRAALRRADVSELPTDPPNRAEARLAWLFVAPALTITLAVAAFPILCTAWESVHRHDLRMPWLGRPFVGLANYREALGDLRFWSAAAHTLTFTAVTVTLELVLGLALALGLNRAWRGRAALRTGALLPWAVPTVVAALAWRFIFESPGGIANIALVAAGVLPAPLTWLADPVAAWIPLVIADLWRTTPFMALILLAGLQNLDPSLLEAAAVDGAGAWRTFVHVTLPLLTPALLVAVVFRSLDALRVFDVVYVLTGGGPGTATEPLSLFALSFTLGPERYTVPVAIALFRGQYQVPWGQILAAAVVTTAPIVLLVAVAQRRIIEGLTAGSVKG
jgi:ABC-type sugar transport system permease subunit